MLLAKDFRISGIAVTAERQYSTSTAATVTSECSYSISLTTAGTTNLFFSNLYLKFILSPVPGYDWKDFALHLYSKKIQFCLHR